MTSSSVPKVENQLIEHISMDHYGSTIGRLASIGVGPCICFVVILDDGHVFLEHRSDTYFSAKLTLKNVGLCFQNLGEHISKVLPASKITALLILDGNETSSRFTNLQKKIYELIQVYDYDSYEDISHYYKELLTTIKLNDVCFNIDDGLKHVDGQSNIDVFIDKNANGDEHLVVIVQHLKNIWNIGYVHRGSHH